MDDRYGALLGSAKAGSDDEPESQDLLVGLLSGGGLNAARNAVPLMDLLLVSNGQQIGGLADLLSALGSETDTAGGTREAMD